MVCGRIIDDITVAVVVVQDGFQLARSCYCTLFLLSLSLVDMGQAQPDLTQPPIKGQQPSLNTTRLIEGELHDTNVLLHIGDVSYARGYAGTVRNI